MLTWQFLQIGPPVWGVLLRRTLLFGVEGGGPIFGNSYVFYWVVFSHTQGPSGGFHRDRNGLFLASPSPIWTSKVSKINANILVISLRSLEVQVTPLASFCRRSR